MRGTEFQICAIQLTVFNKLTEFDPTMRPENHKLKKDASL